MDSIDSIFRKREAEYRAWNQRRADDIDTYVEYMNKNNGGWGNIQIIQEWDSVTDRFLSESQGRIDTEEQIQIAQHILETGDWNGVRIDIDDIYRSIGGWNIDWPNNGADLKNVREAYARRLFYAHLVIENFDAFMKLQENEIVGLHGTQGIAVPSIVAIGGLLSHARQYEKGILTGSGEALPVFHRRDFISFGSVHRSTGFNYASLDLRSKETIEYLGTGADKYEGYAARIEEVTAFNSYVSRLINQGDAFLKEADEKRFGVTFGLSRRALWGAGIDEAIGRRVSITSDVDEMCFAHEVSLEYLPVAIVSNDTIEIVTDILPDTVSTLSKESIILAQTRAERSFANRAY